MSDALVDLLSKHDHNYDSDCGVDCGCSCGAIEDYYVSPVTHEQHLAQVIREHFVVAELIRGSSGSDAD